MPSQTLLTPLLQAYSVLAITLAAGTNLSTTLVTLPALLQSPPSTLARQWKTLFDHGITPVVSLTLSSAAGFALLAYNAAPSLKTAAGDGGGKRTLYTLAAVLGVGLAPYTQVLMGGVNAELAGRATAGVVKEGTEELVRKWGRLNLVRGCMLLVSAGFGVWGCVV